MTDEQSIWLEQATFEDLIEFIKQPNDEFFEDLNNSRMFFARFHDVIDAESKKAVDAFENYKEEPT